MFYKIKVNQNEGTVVSVLKPLKGSNSYEQLWRFEVKGETEPVVLAQMFDEDCFAILNWKAVLRIYSVSKEGLVYEQDFGGSLGSNGLITNNQESLFVAYKREGARREGIHIVCISLKDFADQRSLVLPYELKGIRLDSFQEDTEGNILMYYLYEDEAYVHGFYKMNLDQQRLEQYLMVCSPWRRFDVKPPILSMKHNIGIMPWWNTLTIKRDLKGNPLFTFELMVFNLTDFTVEQIIPVREFEVNQLDCYESTCEDMSENLLINDLEDDDFTDAYEEFQSNYGNVIFEQDSDGFWVVFRGGIFRRVSLSNQLSPLFVTCAMPNNSGKGAFNFPFFHCKLSSVKREREFKVILCEDDEMYEVEITDEQINSLEEIVEVELTECKRESSLMSEEDKKNENSFGKVMIEVKNLSQPSAYPEALAQILQTLDDIDNIRSGHILRFVIKDEYGRIEEEETFFRNAMCAQGSRDKIRQIIEKYAAYDKAEYMYMDEETGCLAYALYYLLEEDIKYLDVAMTYINVIDYEHDVFVKEELMTLLLGKYKQYKKVIRKALNTLKEGAWLELFDQLEHEY